MQLQELCSNKNNRQPSPSPSPSPVSHSLKFQSAYEEFIGRFTFGIEALDSPLLNLKTGDTLGIVGDGSNYRNYTNILMTRLRAYPKIRYDYSSMLLLLKYGLYPEEEGERG